MFKTWPIKTKILAGIFVFIIFVTLIFIARGGLGIFALPYSPNAPMATFAGNVYKPDGTHLAGATVTAIRITRPTGPAPTGYWEEVTVVNSAITDSKGYYRMRVPVSSNPSLNDYKICATKILSSYRGVQKKLTSYAEYFTGGIEKDEVYIIRLRTFETTGPACPTYNRVLPP